jgi:protocadherin-16/23
VPQITILASDAGRPSLTGTATVRVTIRDVNDNEPIFDQSFYNVSVREDEAVGHCVLKVSQFYSLLVFVLGGNINPSFFVKV